MNFRQIYTAVSDLYDAPGSVYGGVEYKAFMLACFAEDNANDTLADKGCTEAELEQTALSSLEMLVGSERDADVRAIFDRLGFKY